MARFGVSLSTDKSTSFRHAAMWPGLAGLAALMTAADSPAALINQLNPVSGDNYAVIDLDLINNNPGAIYNSGELDLLGSLANQLWQRSENQSHYATKADMMKDWGVSIRSRPTGEVYNGWTNVLNADGSVSLSHNNGWAGFDYDQWLSTSSNPNLDMMALTVSIPTAQLEMDGIAGYNPQTDARIELSTQTLDRAFIGNTGTPGVGQEYVVVPEPSALMLLGTLGAVLAGKKLSGLAGRVKGLFRG